MKHFYGGTERVVSPAETIARVAPLQRAMGITRLANVTGLDHIGIPVVAVYRPNARSISVSQGKGVSLDAARASGLMEAVELYHAEHRVPRPVVASLCTVRGGSRRVVDVERLPRRRGSALTSHSAIAWVEARELDSDEPVLVPHEMVHTDFRLRRRRRHRYFTADGNGLASGNDRTEALVHALCELIERDATTLWFEDAEEIATRVDLSTVDDAVCRALLELYAAARVDVAVWETTTDIGVPSFLCQIAEVSSPRRPVTGAHGMGCHPNRAIALSRALTEAAQCRLTWIAGARDDARAEDYDNSAEAIERERASLAVRGPMRSFHDAPTFRATTCEADLQWLLERLRVADITGAAWVDLTTPEFGIPVVRAIAPGLEPARFGAGYAMYRRGRRARQPRARRPPPSMRPASNDNRAPSGVDGG